MMQSPKDRPPKNPALAQAPEDTLRLLVEELRTARADAARRRRRGRGIAAMLSLLLAAAGWSLVPAFSIAQSPGQPPSQATPLDPEARERQRAALVAMLPADRQRELEAFEQQVDWLSGYMQTWEQGDAGAVVAMMLFRMAESMETMPSMDEQMRVMGGQMSALPAIVAELHQINAKLHVITATMDSTMGRAGRAMPWMPFAP